LGFLGGSELSVLGLSEDKDANGQHRIGMANTKEGVEKRGKEKKGEQGYIATEMGYIREMPR
jgi:hypothetical protein